MTEVVETLVTETTATAIATSTTATTATATRSCYDVKDKVVLVTGANRGIGEAFVRVFLEHGAKKVYAAIRNIQSAKECFGLEDSRNNNNINNKNQQQDDEPKIVPLYLDLSKPETIVKAAKQSQDVQIVINNAGVLSRTSILQSDNNNDNNNVISSLENEMKVNVYGLIHMAQCYGPILQKNANNSKNNDNDNNGNDECVFIQINSVASFRCGLPEVCTYSASKAAAYSITQALRQEFQQLSTTSATTVRVISVHPGPIATDMIQNASEELAKMADDPKNVAKQVIAALQDPTKPFHVFPDPKAKQLEKVLQSYTQTVIEQGNIYG